MPWASSVARSAAVGGPIVPITESAASPSGEVRVSSLACVPAATSPEPSASTVPSRASRLARGGRVIRRLSLSPARRPGNVIECDQAIRVWPDSSTVRSANGRASVPKSRVWTSVGTVTPLPGVSAGLPVTLRWNAVAVRSAC